jgi:hypothetical protein
MCFEAQAHNLSYNDHHTCRQWSWAWTKKSAAGGGTSRGRDWMEEEGEDEVRVLLLNKMWNFFHIFLQLKKKLKTKIQK